MASPFSIDAANDPTKFQDAQMALVNGVYTTATQPTPVPAPGATGPQVKPTADTEAPPPGAAPVAAGMAPGQTVPTVAQARAGVPVAAVQPMPPQQQGAAPTQPTLAQRAAELSNRVAQGFGRLFGTTPTQPTQPSPEFVATEARFSKPPVAPSLFDVRKRAVIARNY